MTKERGTLWVCALLAGILCARLTVGVWSLTSVAVAGVSTIFFGFLMEVIIRRLANHTNAEFSKQNLGEVEANIEAMSVEQAKKEAHRILHDSNKFATISADAEPPALVKDMAPQLRELLSQYRSISVLCGEALLAWTHVKESRLHAGMTCVGIDSDATELVVKPSEERIYEVDGSEENESDLLSNSFPTVYHWLLYTNAVLYGD